jgi:hypothetical protein
MTPLLMDESGGFQILNTKRRPVTLVGAVTVEGILLGIF